MWHCVSVGVSSALCFTGAEQSSGGGHALCIAIKIKLHECSEAFEQDATVKLFNSQMDFVSLSTLQARDVLLQSAKDGSLAKALASVLKLSV